MKKSVAKKKPGNRAVPKGSAKGNSPAPKGSAKGNRC